MALPSGIDLDQYKRQAKELLRAIRSGNPHGLSRLRTHHPGLVSAGKGLAMQLADAQLVIAREHEFASWARFREYLLFSNAVAALDAGDVQRLESLLDAHPSILRYHCRLGDWYEHGYFAGATLLRHIAGNPLRCPLPPNILDIARLLASRELSPKETEATIGLLLTSKQASERGVALPLIDVLTHAGAHFDSTAGDALGVSLLNDAPETARELVRRGARMDLHHAAALGDIASLARMLSVPTAQPALDRALVFACIRGQLEAVELLVRRGARGDVLLTPGGRTPRTALHEAANRGQSAIVELLLASGASTDVLDARWRGTAAGWAQAGGHPEVAALISRTTRNRSDRP